MGKIQQKTCEKSSFLCRLNVYFSANQGEWPK